MNIILCCIYKYIFMILILEMLRNEINHFVLQKKRKYYTYRNSRYQFCFLLKTMYETDFADYARLRSKI